MPTRAAQKQATRRAVIDAALRLSAERGFSSLSLRGVAKEAGIAPTSFYRHFASMDELGLALVDEVGVSLRQLVREARRRVDKSGKGSVIRASIQTFLSYVEKNENLFRLLLGEGSSSPAHVRRAIGKEIQRFTEDLAEDLIREAEATDRPIAHIHHAAEAMVTVAFNLGAKSIDLPPEERLAVIERIIIEVRMIMRGAQAEAAQRG
ncbi:MAG: HTH-type transcriptional repressor FabR [Deltaproteobacteria bacterium]|nr:HTH-type transcriptional repressor FabR [Deltaproteobacteria bacterium]MBW2360625.1 HTH-type transcriptional repressor FabR [Deltaproteobacteria bacterium]